MTNAIDGRVASGKQVFTEGDIAAAVVRIAAAVRADYAGEELMMVGVLKGAVLFAGDLMRALGDYPLIVDFIAVNSYNTGRDGSGGQVRLLKDLDIDPAGRHILLVEDIVDEGLTLEYLLTNLRSRGPLSVRSCALLNKAYHRKNSVAADYVGLEAPDAFLVGYGLDFQERFRNIPHIRQLQPARSSVP
ncbi:MAG: hypoxanthine phosphoribosyltransferase [Candidatus Eremiobacteraeota bacterium]|nr:hypoxanthine phosphoribosyltransferase [Candidatus Eremiobacteraeota bacterium]MBC5826520.1 hypoxanthine phosphoribosyltransferase [Candidatus Eremiobacteraeota bacterium]